LYRLWAEHVQRSDR